MCQLLLNWCVFTRRFFRFASFFLSSSFRFSLSRSLSLALSFSQHSSENVDKRSISNRENAWLFARIHANVFYMSFWHGNKQTSKPWIVQRQCDMVLICFYYHLIWSSISSPSSLSFACECCFVNIFSIAIRIGRLWQPHNQPTALRMLLASIECWPMCLWMYANHVMQQLHAIAKRCINVSTQFFFPHTQQQQQFTVTMCRYNGANYQDSCSRNIYVKYALISNQTPSFRCLLVWSSCHC